MHVTVSLALVPFRIRPTPKLLFQRHSIKQSSTNTNFTSSNVPLSTSIHIREAMCMRPFGVYFRHCGWGPGTLRMCWILGEHARARNNVTIASSPARNTKDALRSTGSGHRPSYLVSCMARVLFPYRRAFYQTFVRMTASTALWCGYLVGAWCQSYPYGLILAACSLTLLYLVVLFEVFGIES